MDSGSAFPRSVETNMEATECTAFTDSGNYFGTCGPDGKFKVWDTSRGVLHQEFTPDSHLTSPCSCLAWILTARNHEKQKKTERNAAQDNFSDSGGTLNIAALGTASGGIHLYNLESAKVEGTLEGHLKRVNHLSWSRKTNLFSCGEDNLIIEWNVSTQEIVSKLKVPKESASCILVLPDGQSLISARNTIRWWDLKTKKVIKKFTGHASPVVSLAYASGGSSESDSYVLSAAQDNYISAWPLQQKATAGDVAATFVTVEPPKNISVLRNDAKNTTSLLVVTIGGYLQVFSHKLNGKGGKPLKPTLSIEISQREGKNDPLPFINAKFFRKQALVAYGNSPLLAFEQISTSSEEKTLCLIRNVSEVPSTSKHTPVSVSKVLVPNDDSAKYLHGPKRIVNGQEKSDMPMGHRLEVLALNPPIHDIMKTPTSSMTHQLVQGLYSQNEELLRSVFCRREPHVIYNTISMLPLSAIAPAIKVLAKRLKGKYHQSKPASAWLRALLSIHAGQLLAAGDLADSFSEVMSIVEAKLQVLPPLSQLRGRLDLLVEQVGSGQSGKPPGPLPDDQQFGISRNSKGTAMMNFVDNPSSDEGSDLELALDGSDSEEEQWDEQSNLEDDNNGASDSEDQDNVIENGIDGESDSEDQTDQDVDMGD